MCKTTRLALLLAVVCQVAPAGAQTTRVATTGAGDTAGLIRDLDSDTWKAREEAQKELTRRGRSVAAELRAALQRGALGVEGQQRAEWILAQVGVPEYGAVLRELPNRPTPEGCQDGDIVTACNGQPVRDLWDLRRAAKSYRNAVMTVWRRGAGELTVELDSSAAPIRVRSWPDQLEMFERFAKKDKYDEQVRQALRLHLAGDPNSAELFRKAWDDGCRSLLVAATWLEELSESGRLDEARKVWAEKIDGVTENVPGGLWQYGMIPYRRAQLEIAAGRLDQAGRTLDGAVVAARKADAFMGLACLRHAQAEIKVSHAPLGEAMAFWREHAESIGRVASVFSTELPVMLAGRLAADGDPSAAVEFAKSLPDSFGRTVLVRHYESQVRLAGKAKSVATDKPHWVLVKWLPAAGPLRSTLNYSEWVTLPKLPCPGRIDAKMRLASFYTARPSSLQVASLHLVGWDLDKGRARSGTVFRVDTEGRLLNDDAAVPESLLVPGPPVYSSSQWLDVSLEVRPEVVRCRLNGQPLRTTWQEDPGPELLDALISCAGSEAEFRDIRMYAATAKEADNTRIEQQLAALLNAQRSCDQKLGVQAVRNVRDAWQKAPEAHGFVARLQEELRRFQRFMSPEGLDLCTAETSKLSRDEHEIWEARGASLVGRACECPARHQPTINLPMPYRNFELSGCVEAPVADKETMVWFHWAAPHDAGLNVLGYWPAGPMLQLGKWDAWKDAAKVKVPPGPAPFCLRVRGRRAVLLAGQPLKPSATIDTVVWPGDNLCLYTVKLPPGAAVTLSGLTIRHLPDGADMNGPASAPAPATPSVPATAPSQPPGGQ